MATRGEDKLADIIVGDYDRFLAVEILADNEIAAVVFFLFLLVGFLLTVERHIAQPPLRFLVVVLRAAAQDFVDILVAKDDVLQSDGQEEFLMTAHFVKVAKLVECRSSDFQLMTVKEFREDTLALFLRLTVVSAEYGLNLSLCLGRRNKVHPRGIHMLGITSEYLHLVAALQLVAKRHKFVVDLCTDTMTAQEGMNLEGKVKGRTTGRHGLDFALRSEHENLGSKEIELDGIEEIHGVGLRVVENLFDGGEPVAQFAFVLGNLCALLVFPMGGKTLLGHFVHTLGTNLHLNPPALVRHERHVKRLIAVGLWMVEPLAHTVGMTLVNLGECHIDVEAFVDFNFLAAGGEDDTYGKDIVDLVEGDVLRLHLVPNGIRCLDTLDDAILQVHLVERGLDGSNEVVEQLVALASGLRELHLYLGIFLGMLEAERKVLEFRFYLVESQAIGQRCIDVERFAGNLVLLVGGLRSQRAHIVQTVADLYEDDADVLAHGEQQLLEVLGLRRCLLTEDATRNLGQSVDNLRNLRTKDVGDILHGVVGVFHHVVEQ